MVAAGPVQGAQGWIVCLGTTPALQRTMIFDDFRLDAVNRAAEVQEYASGKPINVARVLKTLGYSPVFIGPLGGARGGQVRVDLRDAAIEADVVEASAATRLCTTIIDRARGEATELVEEHAPIPPDAAEQILARLQSALQPYAEAASFESQAHPAPRPAPKAAPAVVVLTGSIAPGAGDDFYARAIRLASRAGARTLIDAAGPPLELALAERPQVVKINREELARTSGLEVRSHAEARRALFRLAQYVSEWAIVTDGPRGSYACDRQQCWHISVPSIRPISPIGSGDAFAAGLAAAMSSGGGICTDALVSATSLAAASAMTPWAGHVSCSQATELASAVSVRVIAAA